MSVEIDIPRGAQQRMAGGQTGFWMMFGVGTLLAAGLFRLMNRHSKQRTAGELPSGINPLQAALLTGKPVSAKTLASVIINWAARDYIEIQMDGRTIRLRRKRSLIHQPDWEKQFLRSLLTLGDGNTVTLDEICRNSASCVQQACRQARLEKIQWQHKGLAGLRWLLIGLSMLPPMMITSVLLRQTSLEGIVIMLSLGLTVVTTALGGMTAALVQGRKKSRWPLLILGFAWLILLGSVLACFVPREFPLGVGYVCLLITQLILWPLTPLNPEGLRLRQQAVQWGKDLKQMSDAKLDGWLERDPDYAFKSYAYAQTLGLASLWEKRFYEKILPSMPTVVDASGQPERIWVLDELIGRLQDSLAEE